MLQEPGRDWRWREDYELMGSLNKHLTNMIKLTDIVAPH